MEKSEPRKEPLWRWQLGLPSKGAEVRKEEKDRPWRYHRKLRREDL